MGKWNRLTNNVCKCSAWARLRAPTDGQKLMVALLEHAGLEEIPEVDWVSYQCIDCSRIMVFTLADWLAGKNLTRSAEAATVRSVPDDSAPIE